MMLAFFVLCQNLSAQTLTPENQTLYLRHIVEQTNDMSQRESALKLMANTGTYQALTFITSQLQHEALKYTAAQSIWKILSTHPEYNGTETRQTLTSILPMLSLKQRNQAKAWLKAADKNEEGFVCLFNGKDLEGWKGLVENPIKRAKMSSEELAKAQEKADELMKKDWIVENGELVYIGHGWDNICTVKDYADFELLVDWRLESSDMGYPSNQCWSASRLWRTLQQQAESQHTDKRRGQQVGRMEHLPHHHERRESHSLAEWRKSS